MYVGMYVGMYVCMYVCMYVYTHIYNDKLIHRSCLFLPDSKHFADQFCSFFVEKMKTLCSKFLLMDLNPLSLPGHLLLTFSSFSQRLSIKLNN